MVGREHRSHVEAAHALLDDDDQRRPPRADQGDQKSYVCDEMETQSANLDPALASPRFDQERDARLVHCPAEPEKQRKEQLRLMADDPAAHPALGQRLLSRVGDDAHADIGVEVLVIWVPVVLVVLVDPPPVAHAEQAVSRHDADDRVEAPAGEHLAVTRIMKLKT